MSKCILAHDLGTTGDKATLYDKNGELLRSAVTSYETFRPHNGWAEQNPEDWWDAVCSSTKELLEDSKVNKDDIAAISFSGQMMGCLPLDANGTPLRRSIIWADQRSVSQAEKLEREIGRNNLYGITGHRVSPTYSLAKIMWVMENEPEVYEDTYKFVHAKDYIVKKLTGKFVTDYSDASGMNLYDINEKCWSEEIIEGANLNVEKLPEVRSSFDVIDGVRSSIAGEVGLKPDTPVVLGAGDGSAASVGATVVQEGSAYNYIGSSSWIALAAKEPILDPERRTFNWIHMNPELYVPCGTMQAAGASYSWLKETICHAERAAARDLDLDPYELMNLSVEDSVPGSRNLLYLPYLQGERSPHWNPKARGAFVGLTMRHERKDIIRSVLEGVTFNLKIISEIFEKEIDFSQITAIGGGARGGAWRQILADIYDKDINIRAVTEEATSLGAAIAGGVGVGIFESETVASEFNPVEKKCKPNPSAVKSYDELLPVFKKAYHSLLDVYDELAALDEE
ncbi:MAG: xylulokinase [Candidatus Bipolaricaulota bacterium]|nr:xylulokinase [Candidatus Bipolaricaulota bacterium]